MTDTEAMDLERIQRLVGEVSREQLRHVDCYLSSKMGMFLPESGPCDYAVTPDHSHPSYSFVLSFDDHGRLQIGNRLIVPDGGTITAISPGIAHHEIVSGKFSRYIAIFIDQDHFEAAWSAYEKPLPVFQGESVLLDSGLMISIKDYMLEYEERMPGYERLLDALDLKITHALIRQILGMRGAGTRLALRLDIDRVIGHLHTHYHRKITVSEMASVATASPSHFSRIFKSETGLSPTAYLIQIRLKKARKMLRAGDLPITEIAHACGFNSSAHFTSSFLHHFSVTPSDYKKSYKGKA